MKLDKFERTTRGKSVRLVTSIADVTGAGDYELVIVGPADGVERTFAESDFSVTIDPQRGTDQVEKELAEESRWRLEDYAEVAELREVANLLKGKKGPPAPTEGNSIFLSLRRIRGTGSFWILAFPYILGTGVNIWLFLPPVTMLSASAFPIRGDQDLFLRGGGWPSYPTTLMSSTKGGTAIDRMFFSTPGAWNLLQIRLFGFASGGGNFSSWFVS